MNKWSTNVKKRLKAYFLYMKELEPEPVKKNQSRWKTDQLRKTELPGIVNRLIKKHFIKGTVQQDFQLPVFFIIQTSLGHWSMGVNIFDFS